MEEQENYEVHEIIQVPTGWRAVYLTRDTPESYLPTGLGVTFEPVALWAVIYEPDSGEIRISGITSSNGGLIVPTPGNGPESVLGFLGYLAPGQSLSALDDRAERVALEEYVEDLPWARSENR